MIRLLFAALGALGISALDVAGVAPQDQHLYQPDADNTFGCLSDPSIRIPYSQVNDDYCDCPDGSDEPGTAACSNGKFWCAGSKQYIPSRLVDDGVCDYEVCCDGSDERPGLCPDRCAEVQAKQREKERLELEFFEEGVRLRGEMVQQASTRKAELARSVEDSEETVTSLQTQLQALSDELARAEEQDLESNTDPESAQAMLEVRNALRETETLQGIMYEKFLQLRDAYHILDETLSTMSEEYNPNFNDPAVKEAIKVWKEHDAPDTSFPATRNLLDDIEQLDRIKIAKLDSIQEEGWKSIASNLLPPILSKRLLVGRGDASTTGPNAQKVQEKIDEVSASLEEAEKTLKLDSKLLAVDSDFWGPDDVGRSSENLCVSVTRGDFTYEACLFGTAVQLDGYHKVQLGHSTGLSSEDVIEFVGGDRCPNGVNRSLTLLLECGHATEAYSVEEPDVCHYVAKAKSPIVCRREASPNDSIQHDEL